MSVVDSVKYHRGRLFGGIDGARSSWRSMLSRCYNKSSSSYARYGAKGIGVCDQWRKFECFFGHMGERPTGKSLDRINTYGNYGPDNCRWATPKEQANNRKPYPKERAPNATRYEFENAYLTLMEISGISGITYRTLLRRLRSGACIYDAVKPSKPGFSRAHLAVSVSVYVPQSGASAKVLQAVSSNGVSVNELTAITGHMRNNVDCAARRLAKKGLVVRSIDEDSGLLVYSRVRLGGK